MRTTMYPEDQDKCEVWKNNIDFARKSAETWIEALNKMLRYETWMPKIKIELEEFRSENDTAYKEDGNTKCPGKRFYGLWSAPIDREIDEYGEYSAWRNGYGRSVIYFSCEFSYRLLDKKLSSFQTFSFSVCPAINENKNSVRIGLTTTNVSLKIDPETLVQFTAEVRKVLEQQKELKKASEICKSESVPAIFRS